MCAFDSVCMRVSVVVCIYASICASEFVIASICQRKYARVCMPVCVRVGCVIYVDRLFDRGR